MSKLKVIDIILIAAIVVCIVVAIVLGIKVVNVKKEAANKQEQLEQQTIPVMDEPIDIGATPEDDYLDELNNTDPVLESGEVQTFIDENAMRYGDSAKFAESNSDGTIFTYVYDNSDICFEARLDRNGLVSKVGNVRNALGNYPLIVFTGYFPESEEDRIAIYKTLMRNNIYDYATVYMEAGGSTRMSVSATGKGVQYIYVEEEADE